MSEQPQVATTDPDYRIVADRQLQIWTDLASNYQALRFDMAKWLFASLLSINAGSLLVLRDGKEPFHHIHNSALCFFLGMIAAILSGLAIYFNVEQLELVFWQRSDTKMLVSRQFWKTDPDNRWVRHTYIFGVISGISSLACFVIGGILIACYSA